MATHVFKRPVFQSRSRSEFEEKLHFLSKYNQPGVAYCLGQSKATAGIDLEEYDAEHKLQTYKNDCHKETMVMRNHLGSKNVIATMSTAGVAGWRETLILKLITCLL